MVTGNRASRPSVPAGVEIAGRASPHQPCLSPQPEPPIKSPAFTPKPVGASATSDFSDWAAIMADGALGELEERLTQQHREMATSIWGLDDADSSSPGRNGGKAFDQLAAWQLIMGKGSQWKDSEGNLLGHDVISRMDKNSYGSGGRRAAWKMRTEKLIDTETYLAPALNFDMDAARWLLDTKLTGATYAQGRYTSQLVDVMAAPPDVFWQAITSRQEIVEPLARALRIEGYDDAVDKIIENAGTEIIQV